MAFIVALLVVSASGVFAISWTDPCEGEAQTAQSGDQNCPPTCFTCGCCSQAMEPTVIEVPSTAETVVELTPHLSPLPHSREPRGVLHVPKRTV